MARRDIMPWIIGESMSPRVQEFRLNASESFREGEPVSVNADGELTESADDPADEDFLGIAAGSGDTTNTDRAFFNPKTGAAYATGDMVPVWVVTPGSLLITPNWSAAGSAFDDTAPAVANLGDECGLSLISGSWGFDISATNNLLRVFDILNSRKESIQRTGETVSTGTTYYIVAAVVACALTPASGAAQAPAA